MNLAHDEYRDFLRAFIRERLIQQHHETGQLDWSIVDVFAPDMEGLEEPSDVTTT